MTYDGMTIETLRGKRYSVRWLSWYQGASDYVITLGSGRCAATLLDSGELRLPPSNDIGLDQADIADLIARNMAARHAQLRGGAA